jgi:NAD(P)-dependent dehydrogenase (short-subunit alcohol dehydrogenase family)
MTPTRATTPFDATSTATDVIAGVEVSGRRVIVTGGASGYGLETARVLAAAGAEVTIAVRNVDTGSAAALTILADNPDAAVVVRRLDLADPASVAAFVASWEGPLDVLINNAGIMATPEMRTPQGWELQFATDHLGHFALANGLHHALAAANAARVVSVSSSGHQFSPVVFEDIHFRQRDYDPWLAYAQAKTGNILFAVEAHRRWMDDGITINALAPGHADTNLHRWVDPATRERVRDLIGNVPIPPAKTTAQGAATSVLLAASPLVEGISGRYFENCNEAEPQADEGGVGLRGVARFALDAEAAARLWTVSVEQTADRS